MPEPIGLRMPEPVADVSNSWWQSSPRLRPAVLVLWKSWANTLTVSPEDTLLGTTLMEGSSLKSSTSVLDSAALAVNHADVVDVAGLERGRRDLEGHRDLVVAADQRARRSWFRPQR